MDVYTKIQKVLADISPVLEADGGGVEIIDFQDGSLTLNLLGACSGCPMSSITFGVVVENKLREACGDKIKNIYYNKDGSDHNYHLSK